MHSFWQRLNAIFFYTLSVLGFLAFAAAGSTYWHQNDVRVSLSLKKIMLYAPSSRLTMTSLAALVARTSTLSAAALRSS